MHIIAKAHSQDTVLYFGVSIFLNTRENPSETKLSEERILL